MIHKWNVFDIEDVADVLVELQYLHDVPFDKDEAVKWLKGIYENHTVTAFIGKREDGTVSAVIGLKLDMYYHPPHFVYVDEWCLWGEDKRMLVEMWQLARQWGKEHGAVYARRGKLEGAVEHIKWEKLR